MSQAYDSWGNKEIDGTERVRDLSKEEEELNIYKLNIYNVHNIYNTNQTRFHFHIYMICIIYDMYNIYDTNQNDMYNIYDTNLIYTIRIKAYFGQI